MERTRVKGNEKYGLVRCLGIEIAPKNKILSFGAHPFKANEHMDAHECWWRYQSSIHLCHWFISTSVIKSESESLNGFICSLTPDWQPHFMARQTTKFTISIVLIMQSHSVTFWTTPNWRWWHRYLTWSSSAQKILAMSKDEKRYLNPMERACLLEETKSRSARRINWAQQTNLSSRLGEIYLHLVPGLTVLDGPVIDVEPIPSQRAPSKHIKEPVQQRGCSSPLRMCLWMDKRIIFKSLSE